MPLPSSRDRDQIRRGLTAWFGEQVRSPVTIGVIDVPDGAGFSSETYLFDAEWDGGGGSFVVRMAPEEGDHPVFPSYDLSLQVNAMSLVRETTSVPVPTVRWYEPDEEIIGGEFYVMDRLRGHSAPDNPPYVFGSWLTEASPEQLRTVQDHTADIMARLHAIPIDGPARNFLARAGFGSSPLDQHLRYQRWYYDWARDGVEYPVLEEGFRWLEANRPTADPECFNWGDARIGNIMFDDFEPVAVLDWEMACLGAPEADLAWQLMLHHFFLDILAVMEMPNPFPQLFSIPEFVGRYEKTAERTVDLDALHWYNAFNHVRFGIIAVRTSLRAMAVGDMEPSSDPDTIVSNSRLIRASIDGTNPYWKL